MVADSTLVPTAAGQDSQHLETAAGPVLVVLVAVVVARARLARMAPSFTAVARVAREHQTLSPARRLLGVVVAVVVRVQLSVVLLVRAGLVAVVPVAVMVLEPQAQRTLVAAAVAVVSALDQVALAVPVL